MKRIGFLLTLLVCFHSAFAQPILNDVLKQNRDRLFRNIIRNTINSNLSYKLTDSTEDKWEDAFRAIELLHYKSPWIDKKIHTAFDQVTFRSSHFQYSLLELGYTIYPGIFDARVKELLLITVDPKATALCVNYLLKNNPSASAMDSLVGTIKMKLAVSPNEPILEQLVHQLTDNIKTTGIPSIHTFLQKNYLHGQVLLISFQRMNRDFPGLVLIRDEKGNMVKDEYGNFFHVPQLARSIACLPGYLTNGNTPEGIFRMYGFDNSKSVFIGPTNNIQLSMPFEKKAGHYYNDPNLPDTDWSIERYRRLLPENFRNYYPAMQCYYAGKAGRTEIIAHGTTVDPSYYKGKVFYPLTPTQGCLCTKEIWDESTGELLQSDQQKLSDALTKAGGPYGYAIVINIDDRQEPVTIEDILPYLKQANQK